ncbi:MAG: NADPH:quinone oxidoreductase family protein [Burkholderiales bacterium]
MGIPDASVKALLCERLTDDLSGLRLATVPCQSPGIGELLIRVRAAGVAFPDVLMARGLYQHRPTLPFVAGMEAAGEVVAIGPGVPNFAIGERVCAVLRSGAIAESIVVLASQVRRIPDGLDFAHGAAFHNGALTAYVALVRRALLAQGETLLVHGATGGVGVAAVQLGLHLGACVIATGTSDEKLAFVKSIGAHHVLNTRSGFKDAVKSVTGGRGADVVFDPVGGDILDESLRCIAWGGRLLVIGFAGGRIASVPSNIPLIKGFAVIGVRAGEYGRRDPEKGRENIEAIDRLVGDGVMVPHIHARVPFERALDAYRMISERMLIGRVVIEFD